MTTGKKILDSRGSVAILKETANKLKVFSKKHKLMIYEVIDSMIDLANDDGNFAARVVTMTKERAALKYENKEIFSQKVSKLPLDLQGKLKDMSTEELAALLDKAGL